MWFRSGAVVAGCLAVCVFVAPTVAADPGPPPPPPPPPIPAAPVVAIHPVDPLVPEPPPAEVDHAPVGVAPPIGYEPVERVELVPVPSPERSTLTTPDGWELTLGGEHETQTPIHALTTAISSREYLVSATYTGFLTGPDGAEPPEGVLEAGYEIGCGLNIGATGIGLNVNAGISVPMGVTIGNFLGIPIIGANIGIAPRVGGGVTVALRGGAINKIPVTRLSFNGSEPRVTVDELRVRTNNCVGASFLRSYAHLTKSTEESEAVLVWYGATTEL